MTGSPAGTFIGSAVTDSVKPRSLTVPAATSAADGSGTSDGPGGVGDVGAAHPPSNAKPTTARR